MRSRYSAFVLGLGEYLVHSWHPDYLNGLTAADLSSTDTRWDGLEILTSQGGPDDTLGMVEFKAWFLEGDERHCLHERSRFVRHQGRWVYTDGEQDPAPLRVGRNDPCPCGSGKKFKKCCGCGFPHAALWPAPGLAFSPPVMLSPARLDGDVRFITFRSSPHT